MRYFALMSKPTATKPIPQYLVSMRRDLCARLESAEKGHPKPELVRRLLAEVDAFDKANPRVRGARQADIA